MNDSEKQTIVFIPRNFIEKGTFMGGMFKIRNAIEGGILAVLIAVPVIQLPLSLTVRIIILCITALPAAMISLIGIGGESISAFLMNALRFLKNRRVIYRIDVNPDPKNKHRIKKPRNKEPKAKKHKHPKKKSTASMTASGQSDEYEGWRIQIVNGKGIKKQNRNGGSYMQAKSFVSEKTAFIQLTDMDLYTLLKRVDSYITNWEAAYAPTLIINGSVFIALSTAWTPLYEAYQIIAETYQIHFVLKSIEPGCGIYYNTDLTGDFFPDEYCVTYCNESYITPSGESLGQRVEIEECFSSEASLLQRFHDLGYSADSYQQLKLLTEDYEIWIHQFENPYN